MAGDTLDVWVSGDYAGTLSRYDDAITFVYDEVYRRARYTPALSVSMPKRTAVHGGAIARRWLDNLLPDNDEVRERWAAAFGERRATAFSLLQHMGQDCAGAVQVMPAGVAPETTGDGEPVTDADIEARLRALRIDSAAWVFGTHGGRWSLGGAQGKFALARQGEKDWAEPTGRAASTHIFKVGVQSLARSDVAEFVTMRIAALLGLQVAGTQIVRFGEETALISERYDRRLDDNGAVVRVHQEDACQALGLSRASKYESDGGPGAATIAALMSSAVDPRDARVSRELFATALVFNWLVAGTDAHAKNYSFLHVGPRVRMAPLYDLTSAALVLPIKEIQFESRLAMKMGGTYGLQEVQARHLARMAAEVGVEAEWLLQTTARLTEGLPAALEQSLDEASGVLDDATRHSFRTGLTARRTRAASVLALGRRG